MENYTSVPIPITTRGIGIHINNYFNFCQRVFAHKLPCNVHQLYRVSLLQLDVRLLCCQRANVLPFDPDADIVYPLPYFNEFTDVTILQDNFNIVAKAISSVGNFTLNDIVYQPYAPQMLESTISKDSDERDVNDEMEMFEDNLRTILDPYVVTIQNLRNVVVALATPDTPAYERCQFIKRNPLPGANFNNDLLTNPDQIMPNKYDFKAASNDIIAVMELFQKFSENLVLWHMVEPIHFQNPGHLSILVSVHHPINAEFALDKQSLVYSEQSTIRSYQPADEHDQYEGSVNLMNEFPNTLEQRSRFNEIKRWSLRCEYVSTALYNTNWVSAVNSAMPTKYDTRNFL